MNTLKKYQLENGVLEVNNSETKIVYNRLKYGLDLFKFFAGIAFIGSFIKKAQNFEHINKTYEFVLFWFFGLSACILVYFFIRSLFKKVWFHKIELNELVEIKIDDDNEEDEINEDSNIEITFIKNNRRSQTIALKKKNNQLESFLENLKKRNSRIKIKHINSYERI